MDRRRFTITQKKNGKAQLNGGKNNEKPSIYDLQQTNCKRSGVQRKNQNQPCRTSEINNKHTRKQEQGNSKNFQLDNSGRWMDNIFKRTLENQ